MYDFIRKEWFAIDYELNHNLRKYSDEDKKKNEETADKFIKKFNYYIKRKPRDVKKREEWELEGEVIVRELLRESTLLNFKYIGEENQNLMIKVTKEFITKSKEFDNEINNEYISQGLRNLWIINILQLIFHKRLELTSSAFAYSIIYPYTDNFLDNVHVSLDSKEEFNRKLYLMIKGEDVAYKNILEKRVYKLLKNIEYDYDRKDFKEVYNSLLKIHEGQVKSMKQQEKCFIPYERDVLGISIEKGASSVLADGYLVKGNLSLAEKEFCLRYGFLLQLIDDFQDLKSDKENEHITIMSQLAGKYPLDNIINKIINYTYDLFEDTKLLKGNEKLSKIIKDNCILLILCSLALNKEYVSEKYMIEMEKYLPFNISYIDKHSKTTMSKLKRMEGIL